MNIPSSKHPASYRDPSGYVYQHEGIFYRFVRNTYQKHYDFANFNNIYKKAIEKNLLLNFREINEKHINDETFYKTLLPDQITFENYPWEWSFDQFKDAAISTLALCKLSIENGMILKDATPLNVRLISGKMKWIDHLSFEIYKNGDTWIAYRQFCEMFLNPLLIASYCGLEIHRLLMAYPEGLTAQTTAQLLPFHCRFKLHIQLHVFLQAKIQNNAKEKRSDKDFSAEKIKRILDSLSECINSLRTQKSHVKWSNYYEKTILSHEYLNDKINIVSTLLSKINYTNALDIGCNDGTMSLLCHNKSTIIAADSDSECINQLYKNIKKKKIDNVYPVVADLIFPTGGMGWENNEYLSFYKRTEFDLIIALALIHHLCIGKNIPLDNVARLFASLGEHLIIEFVPKDDYKVQEMMANREDIFENYNEISFTACFSKYFKIDQEINVKSSTRKIYYMRREYL